jgi:hypothetical protein
MEGSGSKSLQIITEIIRDPDPGGPKTYESGAMHFTFFR